MFILVISAVAFAIAVSRANSETIEQRVITQPLTADGGLVIDGPPDGAAVTGAGQPVGTVVLDLEGTAFHIRPAAPGEDLRVEATFDSETYGLSESYQQALGDEAWIYELDFERTSRSYALTTLKELLSGNRPEVKIFLPRDLPFNLVFSVQQGGADMELGGLSLVDAELDFVQGGGAVEFSEPLAVPMQSLSINFTQGGGVVEGVGNASPERLDVSFTMAGGFVDLRGPWRNDAEISLGQRMGGMTVQLPRDVRNQGVPQSRFNPPSDSEVPPPTLRFSTSKQYGDIEILY